MFRTKRVQSLCFNIHIIAMQPTMHILLGLCLCLPVLFAQESIKVALSGGEIEGKLLKTANNNSAHVYLKIPYAEPPVNDLRFKNPVNKKPWNGVLSCKEYGPACMSNTSHTTSPQSYIDEDCLHMNVFAGVNCRVNLCPVIFYLHGGGMNYDAATMFPEEVLVDNFASKGIVFITVGSRLGAFGFWWTDTNDATGYYGMYDIVHGLMWVQNEIRNLGGNPNLVTLMGHSSGAMISSYLSLSPVAEGLFHHVLIMSGSALTGNYPGYGTEPSKQLAIKLGCATSTQWEKGSEFTKIADCMRSKDGADILEWQRAMEDSYQFHGPIFDKRFLPDYPDQLAKHRRPYPMMIGSTKNEYSMNKLAVPKDANASYLNEPCITAANYLGLAHKDLIAQECIETYSQRFGKDIPNAVSNLTSDVEVFVPVFRDASTMRDQAKGQVYLYSFDYTRPGMEGFFPAHAQDLTYVMGIHPFPFTEADCKVRKIYTDLIANFAKYGRPYLQWKPLDYPIGFNYFSIDLANSANKPFYHYDVVEFWDSVAPAMEQGATWAEQQMAVLPNETRKEWETSFWIIFSVLILVIIAIILMFSIRQCSLKRKKEKSRIFPEDTDVDESTGLLSSDAEQPQGRNRMKYT